MKEPVDWESRIMLGVIVAIVLLMWVFVAWGIVLFATTGEVAC